MTVCLHCLIYMWQLLSYTYVLCFSCTYSASTGSRQIMLIINEIQKVNQLFGYSSGLGMSVLTFDWAQIAYIGSPYVVFLFSTFIEKTVS